MPLDTSSYALAHLRLDGRRWNELRRLHGQISTQAAADGSSYLEMGNTKILCTISGPRETSTRRAGNEQSAEAKIEVEISVAGFSGVDRKRQNRTDKRTAEMGHAIGRALADAVFTQLYPRSAIVVTLHVLSADGGVLAACINAATLALVDAGVPMRDYVAACTAGSAGEYGSGEDGEADPLLDLSALEEGELPFLTVGITGEEGGVSVLMLETRVHANRLEGMLAVGVDGCKRIREMLDDIVRAHGKRILQKNRT